MGYVLAAVEIIVPLFLYMMVGRWLIKRHWGEI